MATTKTVKITAHQATTLTAIAAEGKFFGRNWIMTTRGLESRGLVTTMAPVAPGRFAITEAARTALAAARA
jgi:hypothetical protein